MRGLFKRNKKVAIIIILLLSVTIVGIESVTSNASVNRYDEWMKKYLEYRTENKDLTNDQIATLVDEEMQSKEERKQINTLDELQNNESTTYPLVTNKPEEIVNNQQEIINNQDVVTKPVVTENPQNIYIEESVTVPVVTEIPDAITLPAVTTIPKTSPLPKIEQKQNNTSPCDCEECIAFYAIYQLRYLKS